MVDVRSASAFMRLLAAVTPLFLATGCGQGALGLMPSVLNDPHNLSLRRSLLAHGSNRLCAEARARSMPLRPHDEAPIAGRFLPLTCTSRELLNHDLYMELGGRGYVWTSLSHKIGFEAGVAVAYDMDFQLDGSTMYIYFRPRAHVAPAFLARVLELPQATLFGELPVGPQGRTMAEHVGTQMMQAQLSQGFTVIRGVHGAVELGLGVVPPGQHPLPALASVDNDRVVVVNDRSELHKNQRDFVPFEVPKGTHAITLLAGVDGVPAIDALLVPRGPGDAWLTTYTTQAATTPPPVRPILDEPISTGHLWRRNVTVEPGHYLLVLDNTETAGRSDPPAGEATALVSYGIELQ